MRGFMAEFRQFIAQGNVLDLAVAVVLGASFGAITTSLVEDILMPPIGYLVGGVDFRELALQLGDGVTVRYGAFLNTVVNFVIVAFALFLVVRAASALQKLRRQAEVTAELTELALLQEIRDLLAAQASGAPRTPPEP
ncbi:large conductance mechanosensitive channel protein MscL [Truepera radiovictrix]|uniref:Large-conductance mechanosensitive channel n=1 Tax=Truepera radiovictrix (strain DSM 17093 / CIP 108686 / LMG 22925 / RQ-24) TaxID=649638 RepID=D7CRW0_TRURR|nr:large conductance mechanosensitive channel protein MscL [Truepera radiovictrix]ADI15288.1 large conductance mechanosensitive channel protein [Truepera radiovictrix DSM 17093]WMT56160.1 large conductance mechanosensitive channel protein MscL [Truepera radiovictrix]